MIFCQKIVIPSKKNIFSDNPITISYKLHVTFVSITGHVHYNVLYVTSLLIFAELH